VFPSGFSVVYMIMDSTLKEIYIEVAKELNIPYEDVVLIMKTQNDLIFKSMKNRDRNILAFNLGTFKLKKTHEKFKN